MVPPAVQCQVYLKYRWQKKKKKRGFLQLYFENFSIFSFTTPVNNILKLDLCRALKKTFASLVWWVLVIFCFNFQKNYILGIFSLAPMGLGQSATDRINSEIIEKDYVGFSLSWDLLKIRKLCNTTSLIFWFKVILHLMNQISLRPEGVWNWK